MGTWMDRRTFLKGSAAFAGSMIGLKGLVARANGAAENLSRDAANDRGGYGAIKPKKANNVDEVYLALPDGFEYVVFGAAGSVMSDGIETPPAHDGMAAFAVNGKIRLVRNHEVRSPAPTAAFGSDSKAYDKTAPGGTTTLIVDPVTRELERDFVSLSGTLVNCAGGPTPWGTWITCEETAQGTFGTTNADGIKIGGFEKDHGYCFEVSATADEEIKAEPIVAMGRFVHEAIAVDPATGIVYLTEDKGSSGLYRFIPNKPGVMLEGGKLQMLAIEGKPKFDTRKGQKMGVALPAIWVDIDEPNPKSADTNESAVYEEGHDKGAAAFARLEGAWYGEGHIFVNATSGGNKSKGQVWRYTPTGPDKGELTLLFESPDGAVLDSPDNLCISPRGGLVICEDGDEQNFLRGLTQTGEIFDLARNERSSSEFAGATFSPDGKTLFVNMQWDAVTLAIWGPWERGVL